MSSKIERFVTPSHRGLRIALRAYPHSFREELEDALLEAYEAGRDEERARLKPQLEKVLGRIDDALAEVE